MPSIGHVKLWITVDDKVLAEYQVEETDENTRSCYIGSVTGKCFEIHCEDKSPFRSHSVRTSIRKTLDGVAVEGGSLMRRSTCHKVIKGVSIDSGIYPFRFADLQATDDDSELTTSTSAADIGTIRIEIRYVYDDEHQPNTRSRPDPVSLTQAPVHEKAKKLTTHRVALGERIHDKRHNYKSSTPLPHFGKKFFVFRYANKDILQARDIIPTSRPSPSETQAPQPKRKRKRSLEPQTTANSKPDADFLTHDEAAEYSRLQEKIARGKKVKVEVKKEASLASRHPFSQSGAQNVIDLTSD